LQGLTNNAAAIFNVLKILAFFYLVFGVISLNFFIGSLQPRCVAKDDLTVAITPEIFCGNADGTIVTSCPSNAICNFNYGNPNSGLSSMDDFPHTFMVLFQVTSLSTWFFYSYALDEATGPFAVIFFLAEILLLAMMVTNLFVALVCFGFSKSIEDIGEEAKIELALVKGIREKQEADEAMLKFPFEIDDVVSHETWEQGIVSKLEWATYYEQRATLSEAELEEEEELEEVEEGLLAWATVRFNTCDKMVLCSDLVKVEKEMMVAQEEEEEVDGLVFIAQAIYTWPGTETTVMSMIILNSLMMAMPYWDMPANYEAVLAIFESIFTWFFVLEAAMKMIALGLSGYFGDGSNVFDFFVTVTSLISTFLPVGHYRPSPRLLQTRS